MILLQDSGADALELNLSCPHGMGERGMGLACGQVWVALLAFSILNIFQLNHISLARYVTLGKYFHLGAFI